MPKYIRSEKKTPFDNLLDQEIGNVFNILTEEKANISPQLSKRTKWELFDILEKLNMDVDGDGKIISPADALGSCDFFVGSPRIFDVQKTDFDDFWKKSQDLKASIPAGSDMGFRFYIGKNITNQYSIVVVPVYGLTPAPTGSRSHIDEMEKTFFSNASTSFFALAPSIPAISKVTEELETCANMIRYKDPIGKELVYFSEAAFAVFINGLQKDFVKMRLNLGRTSASGPVTLLITFFDIKGDVIESSGTFKGVFAQGVFFDQGDLMPPPSISDSFF